MITVVINGQNYYYPEVGDTDWGSIATLAFDAITKTTLQPVKDLNDPTAINDFTLYNDIDFGPTHGLRVLFIQSRSNNPAASGVFRLAKDELVAWRNEDNDGDNTISFDADGDLIVNGVKVTLHGQIVNDDIAAGAGIEESKLALDYSTDSLHTAIENHVTDTNNPHSVTKSQVLTGDLIVNSDVDAAAAIEESKLNLDYSTDSLNTAITTHVSDTNNPHSVTKAQVLTGDLIVNADVDNSAAISESKLDLDYSTSSLNTAITSHTGNTSNPHSTSVANLTDTTITSASSGDVLSYDGSKWVNAPSSSASLSGLSDTDITTPANGDTLVYNSVSTKWENSDELATTSSTVSTHVSDTNNPHSTSVTNLTDTTISGSNSGDALIYDGNSSKWINQPNELGNLIDVAMLNETSGDALVYDGANWINQENSVDNLTNVSISTPSDDDVLAYDSNGGSWNNKPNTLDNLKNTNITTPTDQDALIYDGNSSEWINQANTINNISNVSIDTNTLAVGDALVFDDQDSLWKNDASFTNHIGNAANPHLTTVAKLTDTSITTPSDKQLLQYDQANLQWVNSSDVWNRIEVNDVAYVGTTPQGHTLDGNNNVTMLATDNRHQIITATDGYDITLPSTGIKAGERFIFEWSSRDWWTTMTTPFIFKASDGTAINACYFDANRYEFIALQDNPTTYSTNPPTGWKERYSIVRPYYKYAQATHTFTTITGRNDYTTSDLYSLPRGNYMVGVHWSGFVNNQQYVPAVKLLIKASPDNLDWTALSGDLMNLTYGANMPLGGNSTTYNKSVVNKTALMRTTNNVTTIVGTWAILTGTAGQTVTFGISSEAVYVAPYTLLT